MKYKIQSTTGNLTIKTEVEESQLNKRLNQIGKAFKLDTLIVTDIQENTFTWKYNKASELREQLETLVVQNFKDAWEESFLELINECKATGEISMSDEEYRKLDWTDAKEDFLKDYFGNLEDLIKKESGLF